ncbi:MAG: cytochrome c oxidase assembly protein [Neobacillus sp.]
MSHSHLQHSSGYLSEIGLAAFFMVLMVSYLLAGFSSSQRYKPWPKHRYAFWVMGILCAAASVIGPIAYRSHHDFTWHMAGHLLLGMLGPLLIALSAPMTLLLRFVNIPIGRRISSFLKSKFVRFLSNPIVASIFNFGGLWVLYTTDLYSEMQQNMFIHVIVHIHVFLAGYLFTISMIYIDPIAHRISHAFRATVLVLSLASHAILSKYIYAQPPAGIPQGQAETGGMLMYYGGDFIDLILIWVLCLQWYKASRPRNVVVLEDSSV